jgi:hypothetical protein
MLSSQQAYSLPVGDTKAKLDLFYPFFLTIQFAFFFGWLKVIITHRSNWQSL